MKKFLITLALFCCYAATSEAAGSGTIKIDQVRRNAQTWDPCGFYVDGNVRFVIRYTNDTGERVNILNDFVIKTDGTPYSHITIDTTTNLSWQSAFVAYFNLGFGLSEYPPLSVLTVEGAGGTGKGLPIGYNDTVLAITVWDVPSVAHLHHICIDTATSVPGFTRWMWTSPGGAEFAPEFVGLDANQPYTPGYGYCFVGQWCCPRCCQGTTGNINLQGEIDLSDLSVLIAYLTQTPRPTLACQEEANIDDRGTIDLSDLSRLISYLTTTPRPWLPACP